MRRTQNNSAKLKISSYTPNLALSILGTGMFAIMLLLHGIHVIQHRMWSYALILVACIMEVIGYVLRIMSSHIDPYRISFFVGQYFCITCAPVFIAACIYIYLTQFALWMEQAGFPTESFAGIRLKAPRILCIFITADIACTLLQITGASLIGNRTSKHEDPTQANNILIGGLAVQTAFSILFLCIMIKVIIACSKCASQNEKLAAAWHATRFTTLAVCLAGSLVTLRTIFRVAESADGVFGYLSSHEAFFGALEFAPIILSLTLLLVWHPGVVFGGDAKVTREADTV